MARILKTNLAESTLASGINSSVLSFTVATGEGALFPNPGAGEQMKVRIGDEIILCDSRSGDVFTVNASGRGHESTTAAAHSTSDAVFEVATAEDYQSKLLGYPAEEPVTADDGKSHVWDDTAKEFVFPTVIAPTDLTGLILWLDADALTLNDDDPVSTWDDQSTSSNDFTQTLTARPTYKTSIQNSLPIVRFDGTNDYLDAGTAIDADDSTVFIVCNRTTGTGWRCILAADGVAMYSSNDTAAAYTFYVGGAGRNTLWFSGSVFQIFTLRSFTQDSVLSQTSRIDGFPAFSSGGTAKTETYTTLGSDDGIQFHGGDIAEVLIYDSALTLPEIEDVEAYLLDKWGL